MLRTPPRVVPSYPGLPLPDSPDKTPNQASDVGINVAKPNDDTPNPYNGGLPSSADELSDEDLMAQINMLQAILQMRLNKKRSNPIHNNTTTRDIISEDEGSPSGTSPLNMDTSFDSTASLVNTVQKNLGKKSTASLVNTVQKNLGKKRKGSSSPVSSPARRLRVSAQIHASGDGAPPGAVTPPPRRPPVKRNLLAPQQPMDADEISVLHSRPAIHPPSGISNEQRRFPPNPTKPTFFTASSQSQLRQSRWQNAEVPPVPVERIPPVVLRHKTGWGRLSGEIKRRGLNFTKAQNVTDGIRIFPSTAQLYQGTKRHRRH
ncbi:hypothetical protein QE152_g24376 [Popillia japonica]|uniref:Uncharacterized protein n=1 Tax=Popillia japonica TaxID=7064 RepID=A0AAW1KG32_POPJA